MRLSGCFIRDISLTAVLELVTALLEYIDLQGALIIYKRHPGEWVCEDETNNQPRKY